MDNSDINDMHRNLLKAVEKENLLQHDDSHVRKAPLDNFMKISGTSDGEFAVALACCEALKRILQDNIVTALIEYGESRGLAISRLSTEDVGYIREEKCNVIIDDWLSQKKMSDEIAFTYEYDIVEKEDSHRGIIGFFKMISFSRSERDYTFQFPDLATFRDDVNLYITRANQQRTHGQ